MKTKKNRVLFFAGLLIVALASCADPLKGGIDGTGEEIPQGMGLARIRINAGGSAQNIRTAAPDISNYFFTLDFTAPGETSVSETLDGSDTLVLVVPLAPATWTLVVNGYPDSSNTTPGDLLASGTISLAITAGTPKNFDVFVTPNFNSGVTGSLAYAISFPATVDWAYLCLYSMDNTLETGQEIDLLSSPGATATIPNLSEGVYRVDIDLYDSTNQKAASRSEVAHIYGGLPTPLTRNFGSGDFAVCLMIDDTLTTLAAKLDAALNSPAGVYTIVLNGSETDLTGFSPKTLNVTGNKNTTIILRGNGQTVQLGSTGSLLTLGAASGSSLALELRDITLQGRSGNNVPLVKVNTRGTLNMRIGSIITGNIISVTYASSWGSGVHVAFGGSFSMSGGAVSGNTASYSGGGVSVSNYASFSMSGGAVSDNTASYGGGVSVSRNFSMSGGAVSGNTSSYGGGGGGVCVGGGTFAMSGGAVSGNTLSGTNSYGREVLVRDGTFKMSGEARPERVFLYTNTRSITISGPLSGPVTPIDLGITSSAPLTGYVNKPILKLDTTYSAGNLAELKAFFVLGNSKYTASPWTETAISGYKISDGGLFVAE